jgi:glycosyltransferase involved in cell wall biosynthesis
MLSLVSFLLLLLAVLITVASIVWATLLTRLVSGFTHSTNLSEVEPKIGIGQVTAIVPMRNEIDNVEQCITPLLTEPDISRIIVVDDNSNDGTRDAVSRYCSNDEVQLISVSELEDGWSGKSNACHTGALRANSDWLLFIDADTFISFKIVSRLLSLAKAKRLDAVTCFGGLRCGGIWDRISVPFYFALLNSFIKFGGSKEGRGSYFIGSFVLIKRGEYFRIGGHAAVARELVEDKALSDIASKSGLRIEMVYAPKLVSTEWAPGFKNGTQALTRETLPQMRLHPTSSVLFTTALTFLFALPIISLMLSFETESPFRSALVIVGFLSVGFEILITAYSGQTMQLKKHYVYSFLFILPEIIFLVVLWMNVIKVYTKHAAISWRGRLYEDEHVKSVNPQ